MEQIIESVKPMTDTEPLTVTGRDRPEKHGISGVIFMQVTLTGFFVLSAVMLNMIDKDLFSSLKQEFLLLINKETAEIFVSMIDYIRSFISI